MEGWVDKYPLYYLAWTKEQGKINELGYADRQYFNVKVDYSQEDENKSLEAMKCYVTQYTTQELLDDNDKKVKDIINITYFRRFFVKRGMQTEF